jgi:hypothetical protein
MYHLPTCYVVCSPAEREEERRLRYTYSGVKVTPVTSSASTIDTSGTIDSGKIDGLKGGGVGGVDDLDRDLPSILSTCSCM